MPDFIESPNLKTRYNIDKGTIRQWLFKTQDSIFTNQPIWIYTPYGYSNEKEYPVLYVYDGMPSLYTRPFLNVADNLIYNKKIEPIVIVFIGFEDRWNEYVEQSTEYAKLIAYKLVPFIENNFRVSNASEKRGIVGASASGHGAIVTAFRHSDIFGNVASQGGGAGGYPGLNPLANAALDVYVTRKDKYPLRKIYSEVGNYDLEFPEQKIIFSDGVQQFHKRLKENGIDNVFAKVNSGHNATIWNQNLDKILILFYGK
jgi:enterochelin esterase-like enzyme